MPCHQIFSLSPSFPFSHMTIRKGSGATAMRTFVCTVPVGLCRVTTTMENPCREESGSVLGQRWGWQYVRELNRPTLQWFCRNSAWAVHRHMPILPLPPYDVTYAISEPRPCASLSHGGQRSCIIHSSRVPRNEVTGLLQFLGSS